MISDRALPSTYLSLDVIGCYLSLMTLHNLVMLPHNLVFD